MTGIIFTGGSYGEAAFYEKLLANYSEAVVAAADGGAAFLEKLGVVPKVLLGDMDSVPRAVLEKYQALGVPLERHDTHKDETDTELAVTWCLAQGVDENNLCGATGSRIDHSYSNLFLLNRLLSAGVKGRIVDPVNEVFLVDDHCVLREVVGTTVSVLAFTDRAEGITLKGFEYPVTDGRMAHILAGYGVSNVTVAETAEISVASGVLLVDIIRKMA
ncbi:MAG: thiamine diphosphokinase [Eubacterium sp.]|nr:thiamine diphosphokinase [Eubacterium sp.]